MQIPSIVMVMERVLKEVGLEITTYLRRPWSMKDLVLGLNESALMRCKSSCYGLDISGKYNAECSDTKPCTIN